MKLCIINKLEHMSVAILCILFLVLAAPFAKSEVHAAAGTGEEQIFEGDINYWQNYFLDIEEGGILDGIYTLLNSVANILFYVVKVVGYMTCSIFYLAIDLDMTTMISPEINSIQGSLKNGIFDSLLILALMGAGISIVQKFAKRDFKGVLEQFAKSLGVIVLAGILAVNSESILSEYNTATRKASIAILNGINNNGDGGTEKFAKDSVNVLWNNLVHEPWKALQFGDTKIDDEKARPFLLITAFDPARNELIEQYEGVLVGKRSIERIGMLQVYLIPFVVKCVLYIDIAVIQLVFQIMGIFFFLLGLLVLLVALLPGYDLDFVWIWVKKILETQLSILIMTMLMGLMIKVDNLLFVAAADSLLGWLGMSMLQMAVLLGMYLNRDKILKSFSNMQKSISNGGFAKARLRNAGNWMEGARHTYRSARHSEGMKKIAAPFVEGGSNLSKLAKAAHQTVGNYYAAHKKEEEPETEDEAKRKNINPTLNKVMHWPLKPPAIQQEKPKPHLVRSSKPTGTSNASDGIQGNKNAVEAQKEQKERPRLGTAAQSSKKHLAKGNSGGSVSVRDGSITTPNVPRPGRKAALPIDVQKQKEDKTVQNPVTAASPVVAPQISPPVSREVEKKPRTDTKNQKGQGKRKRASAQRPAKQAAGR